MPLAELPWQIFFTPFGIPIAGLLCVFGWLAIQSVSEAVSQVLRNRSDNELKLELVARGLTTEEIVRIVQVGRDVDTTQTAANPQQPHSATTY